MLFRSIVLTVGQSTSEQVRRQKFRSGRWGDGEDYALLAVAAFETGHDIVARAARNEAEQRGADLTALDSRCP